MIKKRWEVKESTAGTVTQDATMAETRPAHRARFSSGALFTLAIISILALALFDSRNFGFRAGLFPWVIGIPTLILALFQLAKDIFGREKPKAALAEWEKTVDVPPQVAAQRTISIMLWTVGFFLAIWVFGFSYSIPISMLLYLKLAGQEKWPMAIIVTFFTWLFTYGLFERALSIPFPDGLLFTWLK